MSRLLIDERPLVVLPSLARAIGLARALIVQQLHWRLNNQRIREINGVAFISDTYAEWSKIFPFWTAETIRKYFVDMERDGMIISIQADSFDRTKSYTLNYDKLRAYDRLAELFPQAEKSTLPSGKSYRFDAVHFSASHAENPTASQAENPTASLKDKNLKIKRERARMREPKRQPPITDTRAEAIYRQIFPDVVLSIPQAETFELIDALDESAFEATCRLWQANNYNPHHLGNIIDRYRNDLKKAEAAQPKPKPKLKSVEEVVAEREKHMQIGARPGQ